MALTKYTKDTAVIENVGTKPEDRTTLNDTTFKQKWDENATDWKGFFNDTVSVEIDALITAIKGAGWTSESLKGLAELLSTHTADLTTDADGAHGLKIESGTFTPTLAGSTTAGAHTYACQVGKYYKIGRRVYLDIYITLSAKDATMAGDVRINGIPFAPEYVAGLRYGGGVGFVDNLASSVNCVMANVPAGFSYVGLYKLASGDGSEMVAADITATTVVSVTLSYYV